MRTRLTRARWDLIGKAALVVYSMTFLLGLGLAFLVSALLTWSHLDPQRAGLAASVISALLVLVVTGAGAWWVALRVAGAALLHGFLVSLAVALLSLWTLRQASGGQASSRAAAPHRQPLLSLRTIHKEVNPRGGQQILLRAECGCIGAEDGHMADEAGEARVAREPLAPGFVAKSRITGR